MVIHKIIDISHPTICENTYTYQVEIKSNDLNINKKARSIDDKFNNWNFFIEISITNGVALLGGFYFFNSLGQRVYLIVGLTPEEWNCARSYAMLDYCKR